MKWYIEKVSQVSFSVFPFVYYLGLHLTNKGLPEVSPDVR